MAELPRRLDAIIAQITAAPTGESLCDLMAHEIRELIGYDRVMVLSRRCDAVDRRTGHFLGWKPGDEGCARRRSAEHRGRDPWNHPHAHGPEQRWEAEAARRRLTQSLQAGPASEPLATMAGIVEFDEMMSAVLTNARTAVLSVNSMDTHLIQPGTVKSLESLTRRAADVARQMMLFASKPPRKD